LTLRSPNDSDDYFHPVASASEQATPWSVPGTAQRLSGSVEQGVNGEASVNVCLQGAAVCDNVRPSSSESDGYMRAVTSRKKQLNSRQQLNKSSLPQAGPCPGLLSGSCHTQATCSPFEVPIGGPLVKLKEPVEGQPSLVWAEAECPPACRCRPNTTERKQLRKVTRPRAARRRPQNHPPDNRESAETSAEAQAASASGHQGSSQDQDLVEAQNSQAKEHLYQNM
jgi:hypothetical protein